MRQRTGLLISCFLFCTVSAAAAPAIETNKPVDNLANTSQTFIQQAWGAYNAKNFGVAIERADRCVAAFDLQARSQQDSLKAPIPIKEINQYWQLNDVATAKYIKGRVWAETGKIEEAKEILNDVVKNYEYAMAYDPKGWYWSVSDAARSLANDLHAGRAAMDGASNVLRNHAHDLFEGKDFVSTIIYADKCIRSYGESALMQQKELTKYPEPKHIQRYWALNDVGTCYYLAGLANAALGDRQKATERFNYIKENLPYASMWDSKGGYIPLTSLVDQSIKDMTSAK